MFKKRMNLRLFDIDANVIDRSGAESLIPTQEANEIIQERSHSQQCFQEGAN